MKEKDSGPLPFMGDIPRHYEDLLTPFLFEDFADDLVSRIRRSNIKEVLELACGTGCVTKLLVKAFDDNAHLTATDLQNGMLLVAKELVDAPNLDWDVVDMTDIPFEDEKFDLIICQFGLMLVPDKAKALSEMFRVLRRGGQVLFNVWGRLDDNPIWKIAGSVLHSFLGSDPIRQDPGPFSMTEESIMAMVKSAGFVQATVHSVRQTGTIATAKMAVNGFTKGLPVFRSVSQMDPARLARLEHDLESQLIQELGDAPMRSPLHAWVLDAKK